MQLRRGWSMGRWRQEVNGKEGFHIADLIFDIIFARTCIPRYLTSTIKRAMISFPVVPVTGARQTCRDGASQKPKPAIRTRKDNKPANIPPSIRNAGIAASAHFTMKTTIEMNGI